jgi:trehalose synthase/putative maltokinase
MKSKNLKHILVSALLLCSLPGYAHKTTPEWIRNAVFYDIYPSSFMDSDGNGIGDIPGIISKLDYVKSLGVDAIWMNPIFESGWFDGGYDIKDYFKVDPRFGSNADVKRLVEEAHKIGLKVCLDLVPGHSSNQAEWFIKSATEGPDGRYADYYIFSDVISAKDSADIIKRRALEDPDNSKLGPWVPTEEAKTGKPLNGKYRGNFYLKNYYPCQPALNFGYANPDPSKPWQQPVNAPGPKAVRRELKNIMAYWFDLGVDGFRVDMAASLVKNDKDKKETMKLWKEMREWIDREYPGKVLISEWGVPEQALPAGFDVDFLLIHRSPGFKQLTRGSVKDKSVGEDAYFVKNGKGGIDKFIEEYGKKYSDTRDFGYISLFSANHDINRLNSEGRDTPDQIKTFMTFLLTTPCVPFIHYGDEIMMRNVKGLPSVEGSREERSGTRTPMQWDNSPSVGFSSASPENLYLPVFTDNGKLTVETQDKDPNSVLNFVRELIKVRHEHPALANDGDWQTLSDITNPYPWIYSRNNGKDTYVIALNPGEKKAEAIVEIPAAKSLQPILVNGKATTDITKKGIRIKLAGISSAIFKVNK